MYTKLGYKTLAVYVLITVFNATYAASTRGKNCRIDFSLSNYNPSYYGGQLKLAVTKITWADANGNQCAPDDINPLDYYKKPIELPANGTLYFNKYLPLDAPKGACYLNTVHYRATVGNEVSELVYKHDKSFGPGAPGCEQTCQTTYKIGFQQLMGGDQQYHGDPCSDLIIKGDITAQVGNNPFVKIGELKTSFVSATRKWGQQICPIYNPFFYNPFRD